MPLDPATARPAPCHQPLNPGMKKPIETERLLLRELLASDAESMLELNSDPQVMKYTGDKPFTHLDQSLEVIASIQQQYQRFGVGRWAAVLKNTNEFIGWAGLKYIDQLNGRNGNYDLGYRLLHRHWCKGYGTELALACIHYGFCEMQLQCISAYADVRHVASLKVLEKCGLKLTNTFMDDGDLCGWYEIANPA